MKHGFAVVAALVPMLAVAGEPTTLDEPIPIALTISGGISLGSWEAGTNWALVRYIKRHQTPRPGEPTLKLLAVTGASAGNINAFLTAAEWCSQSPVDDPVRNLFWGTWIPVGYDRLFAGTESCKDYSERFGFEYGQGKGLNCAQTCFEDNSVFDREHDCTAEGGPAYRADDALFTRRAFAAVEEQFLAALAASSHEACTLPVGITLTRAKPEQITLLDAAAGTQNATISSQRTVVSLEGRSDHGGPLRFGMLDVGTSDRALRPPTPGGFVTPSDLVELTEASSAFPGAFGPQRLRYCRPGTEGDSTGCPTGQVIDSDEFIDGGLFDNVPLGLAHTLATQALAKASPTSQQPIRFFFMEPDRVRHPILGSDGNPPVEDAHLMGRPGTANLISTLGGSVTVARQYELQTVARYVWHGYRPLPQLLIAGRGHRIVGTYLGAFASFLAQPFREFDYAVGVYDGAYALASWRCADPTTDIESAAFAACVVLQLEAAHDVLLSGAAKSDIAFVFHTLLERELVVWARARPEEAKALKALAAQAAAWSKGHGFTPGHPWSGNALLVRLIDTSAALQDEGQAVDRLRIDSAASARERGCSGLKEVGLDQPLARCKQEAATLRKEEKARIAAWEAHRDDLGYFISTAKLETLDIQAPEFPKTPADWELQTQRELFADPNAYLNRQLIGLVDRQRTLEKDQENRTAGSVLALSQVALLSQSSHRAMGLQLEPSSIPQSVREDLWNFWNFVPYRASVGANGSLSAGWEFGYGLHRSFSLILPFGATWYWHQERVAGFVGFGGLVRIQDPKISGLLGGFDFSVSADGDFNLHEQRALIGDHATTLRPRGEIGVRVLGGKLRISLVTEDLRFQSGEDFLRTTSLHVGIIDLNGIGYWVDRAIRGG